MGISSNCAKLSSGTPSVSGPLIGISVSPVQETRKNEQKQKFHFKNYFEKHKNKSFFFNK